MHLKDKIDHKQDKTEPVRSQITMHTCTQKTKSAAEKSRCKCERMQEDERERDGERLQKEEVVMRTF